MASSQDQMSVATKVEPPLESMSRSFIDVKPDIIKYDVKHTHVVTIGKISTKMEEEHWNMDCSSGAGEVSGQPSNLHITRDYGGSRTEISRQDG